MLPALLLLALPAFSLSSFAADPPEGGGNKPSPPHGSPRLSDIAAPDDSQLEMAVGKALRYDENTMYSDIEVGVEEGVVTLSGFAPSLPIKRFALELTETVGGVRSIVNRVVVRGEERTDEQISEDLARTLEIDSATAGVAVNPIVSDGVVRLHGTVGSYDMSWAAEELAESVRGVKGVLNLLHVEPTQPREAEEIEQHLALTLRLDPWLQSHQVAMSFDAQGAGVTLRGTVSSLAEKRHLLMQVQRVSGVTKIDAEALSVIPGLKPPGEKILPAEPRSDGDIEKSIDLALRQDPRLRGTLVEVDSSGGTVVLKGKVGSLKGRLAAEDDARNTPGVNRVQNEIEIDPTDAPSDEALGEALGMLFAVDALMIGSEVETKAVSGVVSLQGEVKSEFQRQRAGDLASRAIGVVEVKNHLRVDLPKPSKVE